MPIVTPAHIRKQIAAGTTDPVYLLQGEDEVEKSALAHEFEELVDEGLRAFNVERLHANDVTTGDAMAAAMSRLTNAVRTFPMMAPRRVVLLLQADGLLIPKRDSEAAVRALEELETLLKTPEKLTTLVIVAGTLDKRSKAYKLLLKYAVVAECGAIADVADAERWVKNRVAAGGAEIEPAGARLLADRCGTDVRRLRNDVDRLLLYALGQKRITVADVREIVGSAALQDEWAMTNAIEAGDGAAALRQLAMLLDSGAPPEKVLGQLGWLVRTKLAASAPGGVVAAVDAVFRTDVDLKSSGGDPRVLLERLVVELCAGKRQRAYR